MGDHLCLQDRWTPLMYAVKHGFVGVVRRILECGEVDILATNAVRNHHQLPVLLKINM